MGYPISDKPICWGRFGDAFWRLNNFFQTWRFWHGLTIYIYWLVVYLPLWKLWLRHLGRWHSQYMEKQKMIQTTNHIYIYTYLYMCFNWRKWGLVAIYPPTVNVQTEINNVHQNRLSKSWNADLGIKNRCVTREYMKNERATVQTWSITQNRVFWWEHDTFGGVPFSEKLDKPKWWNTMTWCDWNAKPYIMYIS